MNLKALKSNGVYCNFHVLSDRVLQNWKIPLPPGGEYQLMSFVIYVIRGKQYEKGKRKRGEMYKKSKVMLRKGEKYNFGKVGGGGGDKYLFQAKM